MCVYVVLWNIWVLGGFSRPAAPSVRDGTWHEGDFHPSFCLSVCVCCRCHPHRYRDVLRRVSELRWWSQDSPKKENVCMFKVLWRFPRPFDWVPGVFEGIQMVLEAVPVIPWEFPVVIEMTRSLETFQWPLNTFQKDLKVIQRSLKNSSCNVPLNCSTGLWWEFKRSYERSFRSLNGFYGSLKKFKRSLRKFMDPSQTSKDTQRSIDGLLRGPGFLKWVLIVWKEFILVVAG